MESRRPTRFGVRPARTPLLPMPRLCLEPGEEGVDRTFVELTCPGCIPGGCALAIGWEPGRDPEGRR